MVPCLFFLSSFGTFLWACCRLPSRHTHTLLSRCIACTSVVVLTPSPLVWILSLNQFCFASAFMLAFYFLVIAPCYFLSLPYCFLLLLARSTLLHVSPCCFALQSTPSQSSSDSFHENKGYNFFARAAELLNPGVAYLSKNSTGTSGSVRLKSATLNGGRVLWPPVARTSQTYSSGSDPLLAMGFCGRNCISLT